MKINRIAEVLKQDGETVYKFLNEEKAIHNYSGLEKCYLYNASNRVNLEDELNYLGLQDLYEDLKDASAFAYLTTEEDLEELKKVAKEKAAKDPAPDAEPAIIVGIIEIFQ